MFAQHPTEVSSTPALPQPSIQTQSDLRPRNHVCLVCSQKFRRAEHLKRHIRRHTLEKPYQCSQCLTRFARKELHDRHLRVHHVLPDTRLTSSVIDSLETSTSVLTDQTLPCPPVNSSMSDGVGSMFSDQRPISSTTLTSIQEPTPQAHWVIAPEFGVIQDMLGLGYSQTQGSISPWLWNSDSIPYQPLSDRALSQTGNPNIMDPPQFLYPSIPFSPGPSFQEIPFRIDSNQVSRAGSVRPEERSRGYSSIGQPLNSPSTIQIVSHEATRSRPMTPYSFFLNGISIPSTPRWSFDTPQEQKSPISDTVSSGLREALQELKMPSFNSDDPYNILELPDEEALSRYHSMFFAAPNRNLPFTHEESTMFEDTPAVTLALLADGAMYCGDRKMGEILFEASRRLVSKYMETHSSEYVPLWVFNTLLTNSVFGLPGGEAPTTDVTIGSLESLIRLAPNLEVILPPVKPVGSQLTLEQEWRLYIDSEMQKRSLLCVLIVVGLWSAAYGSIEGVTGNFFNNLELPSSEVIWTAKSAEQWKALQRPASSPCLQDAVESLFISGSVKCSGLTSLCLIVGLLIYTDELRNSAAMSPVELNDHVAQAVDNWSRRHDRHQPENAATNFIAYPAAAHLRLSLQVDIRSAMKMFLAKDFSQMRTTLRQGNLAQASLHGLAGLIPWAVDHRNQISMVSIPCALVVSEWVVLVLDGPTILPIYQAALRDLKEVLNYSALDEPLTPFGIWRCLKNLIDNGPTTNALYLAMEAYSTTLANMTDCVYRS